MTNKELVAGLKRIEKEVHQLLEKLAGDAIDQSGEPLGHCRWCGEPYYDASQMTRDVHTSRCYSFIYRRIQSGEFDEAKLVAEGKLGPKAKSGRKKLSPEEHRQRVAAEEAGTQIAKKARKSK